MLDVDVCSGVSSVTGGVKSATRGLFNRLSGGLKRVPGLNNSSMNSSFSSNYSQAGSPPGKNRQSNVFGGGAAGLIDDE